MMATKTLISAHYPPPGSFSDRRVILMPHGQGEAASLLSQACDGPSYLRIGGATSDATLSNWSTRLSVPLAKLTAFRAEVSHHG